MKKTLLLLAFLFSSLIYSQEATPTNYDSSITITPLEVYSSAVMTMDFKDHKDMKYTITKNGTKVSTEKITKNEGSEVLKMDFSFLNKGTYELHVFINDTEVKKQTFKKL